MKDNKSTVRYLGYRTLPDGGRGFDFSVGLADFSTRTITIEAPKSLFTGPEQIAIQEGAAICFETLKSRVGNDSVNLPSRFNLTAADVAEHRKMAKPHGRRH